VIVPARRAGAPARTAFESYAANWRCCADLISFIVSFISHGATDAQIEAARECLKGTGVQAAQAARWFAWQTQAARVLRAILFFATCVFVGRAPPTRCAALGFKFKKSANSGGESRLRRRAMSLHGTLRT